MGTNRWKKPGSESEKTEADPSGPVCVAGAVQCSFNGSIMPCEQERMSDVRRLDGRMFTSTQTRGCARRTVNWRGSLSLQQQQEHEQEETLACCDLRAQLQNAH
ncbi:hypothetical protein JOB18_001837 [Solea senegalensis]|uniref:Uncharacterized protein n=1 Tax=Solea senegalensis TaxID=28829 RepID=A0AAV6QTD7_SOLSE|nr:hypothetical protein JOB18_001837 [Solea senegalensis]